MLTKAIVVGFGATSNKYKIRIPILDGFEDSNDSTPNNQLSEATLCNLPGIENPLSIGDIVYVDFEDNNLARPVILGHLYLGDRGKLDTKTTTSIGLTLGSLNVEDRKNINSSNANLPINTSIGEITYEDLLSFKKFMMWDNFKDPPNGKEEIS